MIEAPKIKFIRSDSRRHSSIEYNSNASLCWYTSLDDTSNDEV